MYSQAPRFLCSHRIAKRPHSDGGSNLWSVRHLGMIDEPPEHHPGIGPPTQSRLEPGVASEGITCQREARERMSLELA